jgi:hypothetical protein
MLLTIATLLPLLSTAITLITSGQFSSNTNWTVYNSPLTAISNTISTVPYQYVDVVDPAANLVRVRYNFSAGAFPQVRIFLMQGSVEALLDLSEFRVDGYEDLKLELTANLTSGTVWLLQQAQHPPTTVTSQYPTSLPHSQSLSEFTTGKALQQPVQQPQIYQESRTEYEIPLPQISSYKDALLHLLL